jgi:hypothetical protein
MDWNAAYFLRSILVMGLTFGFTNVAGGLSVAAEKTSKKTKVESFARYGFEPEIPGVQADGKVLMDDVLKRFGEDVRTKYETGPDGREPQVINELATLEYPGLTIRVWRNDHMPERRYKISAIMLTSPEYRLKYGLRVGQPKTAFLKVLGAPNDLESPKNYKDNGVLLAYEAGVDPDEKVVVRIEFDQNDLATKITWFPTPFD